MNTNELLDADPTLVLMSYGSILEALLRNIDEDTLEAVLADLRSKLDPLKGNLDELPLERQKQYAAIDRALEMAVGFVELVGDD